jgi:hypothetical protein
VFARVLHIGRPVNRLSGMAHPGRYEPLFKNLPWTAASTAPRVSIPFTQG